MWQFPIAFRVFFGKVRWNVPTEKNEIFLTFDDGPVPEVTPYVLDLLDQYQWKATFFCVGENVAKHPEIFHEILKRGHKVGNHTFHHLNGLKHSCRDYLENVRMASELIPGNLFRPPYGKITPAQLKELKKEFNIVMWDLLTHDYSEKMTPERIFQLIQRELRKGSIVVFHDSVKAKDRVLKVLPAALEFWNSKGYTGGILSELTA